MISSASPSDRTGRTEQVSPPAESGPRRVPPRRDDISTEQAAFLRSELTRQPEIRPDVVARAQQLAADPNYPGRGIIEDVAKQLLRSPDPTEYDV